MGIIAVRLSRCVCALSVLIGLVSRVFAVIVEILCTIFNGKREGGVVPYYDLHVVAIFFL